MSTLLLVPGAWLGAWAWRPVTEALQRLGHEVHPVTLSGLAERAGDAVEKVGLGTHIADVHEALRGLRDVTLVGHSYAGIVAGAVAAYAPESVRRTVFVDANLPRDGQAFTDGFSERGRELVREQVAESAGYWAVPDPEEFDGHDLNPDQVAWLRDRCTPHPGRTLFDKVSLARPPAQLTATYIHCLKPGGFRADPAQELRSAPGWSFETLDTGHWPMVSRPKELATLLHEIASR